MLLLPKENAPLDGSILFAVIVPVTVRASSIVTVEPELVIVLPVKDNSPSVCVPDPLAVKLPEIVTLGVNAVVIVSVADTVCVI